MASGGEFPYRLEETPKFMQQLRELSKKAQKRGLARQLADALQELVDRLQTAPAQWGDPEWPPKKEGSCVYHRVVGSLWVKYVVFENEKLVGLLDVRAMPRSSLA